MAKRITASSKKPREHNEGQMSTDDFKDLPVLHAVDWTYHHRDCQGKRYSVRVTDVVVTSKCSSCGLWVTTTKSAVDTMRMRDGG